MAVEKLYESDNYLIVNKPYDMYINSDDEHEKVSSPFCLKTLKTFFMRGYVYY